jgi:hypothetical protein
VQRTAKSWLQNRFKTSKRWNFVQKTIVGTEKAALSLFEARKSAMHGCFEAFRGSFGPRTAVFGIENHHFFCRSEISG